MTAATGSSREGTAVIILAAGASSRLGQPKQLLAFRGKTLLSHSISIAQGLGKGPVLVVLGANAERLEKEIARNAVHIIHNMDWSQGMSTSIRGAVLTLQDEYPGMNAIILVCDQPYISTKLLVDILEEQEKTAKPVVAARYGSTLGVPAFFHQSIFPELLQLEADAGAKKIILQDPSRVAGVAFPEGAIDIDTAGDYERLQEPA